MRTLLIALALLLLPGVLHAKNVDVEAIGVGDDYDWAVMNAIDNAVKQSSGVSISRDAPMNKLEVNYSAQDKLHDAETLNAGVSGSASHDDGAIIGKEKRETYDEAFNMAHNKGFDASSDRKLSAEIKEINAKYEGKIKTYKVLSSEEKDGKYIVKILATIFEPEEYESPKLVKKSKYSLSILPFKADKNIICVGKNISSESLVKQLQNSLNNKVSATKQFNIVDRENLNAYADELSLINDEYTREKEKSRLKNITSADYMLVGTIENFSASTQKTTVEITGESYNASSARLNVSYKLIETATMEVITSSSVSKKFNKEGGFSSCKNVENHLSQQAAAEIVDEMMRDIFPDYSPKKEIKKEKKQPRAKQVSKPQVVKLPFD